MTAGIRWRDPVTAGQGAPPAMMTAEELGACRRWARERSSAGGGRIVELGCFLGASTSELAVGARDGRGAMRPIIVHDAFETHASMRRWIELPFRDGESFRPLFDLYTRAHAERLDVREGRVPEDLPAARGAELYPEQEPIGLLFIDLAKTEGVSRTVVNTFIPWLEAGGVVLHQELQYCLYPWLGLHFSQIADRFEAVEDVPGWMTALRCQRPSAASELPEPHRLREMDPDSVARAWDRAAEWWAASPYPGAASHAELQRVAHLRLLGDAAGAVRAATRAELRPHAELVANIDALVWTLRSQEKSPSAWDDLVAALGERRAELTRDSASLTHEAVWRAVASRCRAEGFRRVALAGGGSFCRDLLASGWPFGELEVVCVIDDHPRPIDGVTVLNRDEAPSDLDAVVLCSTHAERDLERMVRGSEALARLPILPVYSASPGA